MSEGEGCCQLLSCRRSIGGDVRYKLDHVAVHGRIWQLRVTVERSLGDVGGLVVLLSPHVVMWVTREPYRCSRGPAEAR